MSNLPADFHLRLAELRKQFEQQFDSVVLMAPPPETSISIGMAQERQPEAEEPTALAVQCDPHETRGTGATAVEALEDWAKRLPTGKSGRLLWRTLPEIASDRDFDRNAVRFWVYSRCAIMPSAIEAAA